MQNFTVTMVYRKNTKHTVVYEAQDTPCCIEVLYINNAAFKDGRPDKIEVTVEVAK